MFFPGFGSGQEKIMDPDPVCPKRLDSDLVNIRPDPKPSMSDMKVGYRNRATRCGLSAICRPNIEPLTAICRRGMGCSGLGTPCTSVQT